MTVAPYITGPELGAYCEIPSGRDDAGLIQAAAAACRLVTNFCEAAPLGLRLQPATEQSYGTGATVLVPRRGKVASVEACEINDRPVAVRIWDGVISRLDQGAFDYGARILLRYTAGLDPLPDDVVFATLRTGQGIYLASVRDPNLQVEQIGRAFSGAVRPGGAGSLPKEAENILAPHRWTPPF